MLTLSTGAFLKKNVSTDAGIIHIMSSVRQKEFESCTRHFPCNFFPLSIPIPCFTLPSHPLSGFPPSQFHHVLFSSSTSLPPFSLLTTRATTYSTGSAAESSTQNDVSVLDITRHLKCCSMSQVNNSPRRFISDLIISPGCNNARVFWQYLAGRCYIAIKCNIRCRPVYD